jgi:hypothetical protein
MSCIWQGNATMLWDALQLRCIVDHLLHQFALVFKMYVSERLTQWHEAFANHRFEAATRGTQTLPLVSPLTPVIPLDLRSTSDQSTQAEDVLNRDIESIGNDLSRFSLDEHRVACVQKDSSQNSKVTPQESSAKKNRGKGPLTVAEGQIQLAPSQLLHHACDIHHQIRTSPQKLMLAAPNQICSTPRKAQTHLMRPIVLNSKEKRMPLDQVATQMKTTCPRRKMAL